MGNDQKRAFAAVLLSGLILFGWQYFFAPETQPAKKTAISETSPENAGKNAGKNAGQNVPDRPEISKTEPAPGTETTKESSAQVVSIVLENQRNSYTLNSRLTVVSGEFKPTNSSMDAFFTPGNNQIQFLVGDVYRSANFNLKKISDTEASFSNEALGITGSVVLDPKGFLVYQLTSDKGFGYRFMYKEVIEEGDEAGFFAMQAGASHKQFGYFTDEYNTIALDSSERGDAILKWFSVDNDYHLFANVLGDKKPMLFSSNEKADLVVTAPENVLSLEFKQIFARKEYDQLGTLGHNLNKSIDFGIWGVIAVPILRGLQFFYSVIPNYGISIVLLTILIRMLTFPLQYKSFKSMKKMQEIQPDLAKLKEKHKNDPQKMQQETMALFKKAGANPLGGCLPMILQMPVFFAFYKVLYSSVELVNAPFFGWIHDLSEKDPYYVLPILMGLAMVLNQKLMPTSVSDPVQKKVMLFMPLIFAIFMKDFPAGLTLYIFISTLMGMGQQLFVYKRA